MLNAYLVLQSLVKRGFKMVGTDSKSSYYKMIRILLKGFESMNTGGVFDSHITEWNCDTELPGGLSGGYMYCIVLKSEDGGSSSGK